jgi:hypothetical protein
MAGDPDLITTFAQVNKRKFELETLPEDWYVDLDGSYASRPTKEAIERACDAARRALTLSILVEAIDADANGGTCVDLRNANYAEVHVYFSNGGSASVVGWRWSEAFTEASWERIREHLAVKPGDEGHSG